MFIIKCDRGYFNGFDVNGVHFTDRPSVAWTVRTLEGAAELVTLLILMASDVEVMPAY